MATMRVMAEVEGQHFTGFPKGAFGFFRQLKRNNDREWFAARKGQYEQTLLAPMLLLVRDLAGRLYEQGLPLQASRKTPVHRIYRDIRFSNDKTPFQTHISSALHRDGDKMAEGVVYVHLDVDAPFAAAGFWLPEKASLRRWRDGIVSEPKALLHFNQAMPLATEDVLQRMPRGYERHTDSEIAPLLRLKSFLVKQDLSPETLGSPAVLDRLADFARQAAPLLHYGWGLE